MDIDDGGPAFPTIISPGMSLRDWFAGQAMAAEIVDQGLEGRDAMDVANMAYEMADAMLAAREQGSNP